MNKSIIISIVILILLGVFVSRIKYEVVFLRKNLKSMENEIEKQADSIKILKAEWSYLNEPARLKKLCKKYLKDMKPIVNSQIMSYDKIMSGCFEEKLEASSAFDSFISKAIKKEKLKSKG